MCAHLIQKRDLVDMLQCLPDYERLAVALDGNCRKLKTPGELEELLDARKRYFVESSKEQPSFEQLATLADTLIERLEERLQLLEGLIEDHSYLPEHVAIESVQRRSEMGRTEIICSF